jgi:dienelactone hydrolase
MVLAALMVLAAQVPAHDSRLTGIPNTDTHFPLPSYHSLKDWEQRRLHLRRQMLFAAGLDPMPEKTPLHAQIFGRVRTKDCTIEKVLLETMPGYYLGGNLYRPLNAAGKHPAVLNPHGHWTYGRLENQPLYSGPSLGANLARQGYVVFAWDMVGYNDTIQTPHAFGTPAEQLWSFGPYGLQLWNSIRALDFVSELTDVDPSRIAMTGASGGATQTISLAAVDDRIQFYAPVNMISSYMQGGDFCENAPGLRLGTNNVEIAAMIAPKPLLMVSATGDWTKNTPTEEYPAIRRIYELYGKPENVETIQLDAPHNFNRENREAVYRFFAKHILHAPDAGQFREKSADIQQLQNMLALSGRALPPNAISYNQLFAEWKRRAAPADLSLALAAEWPREVISDNKALSRPDIGDRVPYSFTEGSGMPALIVGGTPKDAPAGRPALRIEVFKTRDHSAKHFESFNKSDDQLRVQDILTALAWLHGKYPGPVELIGVGTAAGVWCEFAAAVAPVPVRLHIDIGAFTGTDEDFLRYFNVPGIQLAGGLAEVNRLTAALK